MFFAFIYLELQEPIPSAININQKHVKYQLKKKSFAIKISQQFLI